MKLILSIIVAVFALVPVTLYAGLPVGAVTSVEIELNEGEGTGEAEGAMWFVRSSKDDVETIGCSQKGETTPSIHWPEQDEVYRWAWCQAKDESGLQVFCLTKDPNLLDAMQAISPFSYIRFTFENAVEDTNGIWMADCTRLDFSTQSNHLPLFTIKRN